MRNRVLGLVTALTLAALLYGSATPAAACTCTATTVAREVDAAEIVVTGKHVLTEDDGDGRFAAERYLKGSGPNEIVITYPYKDLPKSEFSDCHSYAAISEADELLFLTTEGSEIYAGNYCTGLNSHIPGIESTQEFIEAIADYTDGSKDQSDDEARQAESLSEHKDIPWIPIILLAFAVPLAALFIPALFIKRKRSDH